MEVRSERSVNLGMPSGRVHARIDLFALILIAGCILYFRTDLAKLVDGDKLWAYVAAFVGAYLFGTFFMSPDMDLDRCRPSSNWGILRFLWHPYARIFKHRGLSHVPIFGTLTRVLYLLMVAGIVVLIVRFAFGLRVSLPALERTDLGLVLALGTGLCLSDLLHIAVDWLFRN